MVSLYGRKQDSSPNLRHLFNAVQVSSGIVQFGFIAFFDAVQPGSIFLWWAFWVRPIFPPIHGFSGQTSPFNWPTYPFTTASIT
jgi:hypothetical protein